MTSLFPTLSLYIDSMPVNDLTDDRKMVLQPLITYIQIKVYERKPVNLNFICTHNSRRSHLTQIWAQTMATFFGIRNVQCYSGGTEATAMFPMIVETLQRTGFGIDMIAETANPVYVIKFGGNAPPIIGFSKRFDNSFNPAGGFAAVMTCSDADQNCPMVSGAEKRISVTYEDPKISDGMKHQRTVYEERSQQIATEMQYVFSKISN